MKKIFVTRRLLKENEDKLKELFDVTLNTNDKIYKPEEIIEKMIGGRLNKYYQESVLLEQTFVIDGESKVSEILNSLDCPIEITNFVRFELGEGIEKSNEEDFASEVDSMISGN